MSQLADGMVKDKAKLVDAVSLLIELINEFEENEMESQKKAEVLDKARRFVYGKQ